MFDGRALDGDNPALNRARTGTWTELRTAVTDAVTGGWGNGVSSDQLTLASWAAAHGVATLAAGHLQPVADDAAAEEVLRILGQALVPPAVGPSATDV